LNIFALDDAPDKAAQDHCDKHVVKMILESAQMMSTAISIGGGQAPYKSTHANHPCSIWTRQTKGNYLWLLEHHVELLNEYKLRYGNKTHKTEQHLLVLSEGVSCIPDGERTPFAQAMPEHIRIKDDPVQAYRNYYMQEKSSFAVWKNGKMPIWWKNEVALI